MVVVTEPTGKKWLFGYRCYKALARHIIKVKVRYCPDYIKSNQNNWLKSYFDVNTALRKKEK